MSKSCSIVSYILYGQPIRIYSCKHKDTAVISKKLNEIQVSNLKCLQQWTIDSFFKSTDFMRKICTFVKTFERRFSDKIFNMCFHEVPRYYDKEVQFVIFLNMLHLNNMNFPIMSY